MWLIKAFCFWNTDMRGEKEMESNFPKTLCQLLGLNHVNLGGFSSRKAGETSGGALGW